MIRIQSTWAGKMYVPSLILENCLNHMGITRIDFTM